MQETRDKLTITSDGRNGEDASEMCPVCGKQFWLYATKEYEE